MHSRLCTRGAISQPGNSALQLKPHSRFLSLDEGWILSHGLITILKPVLKSPTETGNTVTTGAERAGGGGGTAQVSAESHSVGMERGKARDWDLETAFLFLFCNELAMFPWADQFLSLIPSFLIFYNQMQNLQGFPFQFKRAHSPSGGEGCTVRKQESWFRFETWAPQCFPAGAGNGTNSH